MMRILVDGQIYGAQAVGGISRYFTEILSRVARREDMDILLHLPAACAAETPSGPHLRAIRDARIRPGRLAKAISRARARLQSPRVFHSTYYADPYWPGMRSVVTVYDFIYERFPAMMGNPWFVEQKRRVIEQADAVVAISESTRNDVLAYTRAAPEKVTVVHPAAGGFWTESVPPAELDAFRKRAGVGATYWVYVGKRELYKNFEVLLRAFARVAKETDGYLLLVGGEPNLSPWQVDYMARQRLERRVVFLPGVEEADLRLAYAGAAALACPSLAEGFGIPLVEAMACGTPVAASDIPVFREVCGDAALFFDPDDEVALADSLRRSLDPSIRAALSRAGRDRAASFSWDQAADRWVDVYRSLG